MSQNPATLLDAPRHHTPPGTAAFGMWLFLAALLVLFAGSILVFLIIRITARDAPPMGALDLPWPLWASTVLILLSSYTMHRALQNVRHERQTRFQKAMLATFLLSIGFLLVQAPAMAGMLRDHYPQVDAYLAAAQERQERLTQLPQTAAIEPLGVAMPIGGLVFFLILVHALHVLGGILPMAVVTYRSQQGRYDHEHHQPVHLLTMYWHFLDGVWIVMFAALLLAA